MAHCSFCEMTEQEARANENARVIELLTKLNAIRRDALGYLVAVNTDATETIYLTGLEIEK